MYYPVGWPRVLRLPPYATGGSGAARAEALSPEEDASSEIRQVVCNRDKILAAILTEDALQIWYIKVRPRRQLTLCIIDIDMTLVLSSSLACPSSATAAPRNPWQR